MFDIISKKDFFEWLDKGYGRKDVHTLKNIQDAFILSQLGPVQNKRIAILKEFAANYDTMTDKKADEIMLNYFSYQQELLKMKKSYYGKFKRILPKIKVARYFQLENKIQVMIDAQLSAQIPLLETK